MRKRDRPSELRAVGRRRAEQEVTKFRLITVICRAKKLGSRTNFNVAITMRDTESELSLYKEKKGHNFLKPTPPWPLEISTLNLREVIGLDPT